MPSAEPGGGMMENPMDYRSPDSSGTKLAAIRQAWGDAVPDCLYYDIGGIRNISGPDVERLTRIFFDKTTPKFGEIEVKFCFELKAWCVRIRNASRFVASFELCGRTCHLYQAGYCGALGRLFRSSPGVSFLEK